jgi:hypothetical protein
MASDVDDGSQVEPLLEPITAPLASLIGDGAYDKRGPTALSATAILMLKSSFHHDRPR